MVNLLRNNSNHGDGGNALIPDARGFQQGDSVHALGRPCGIHRTTERHRAEVQTELTRHRGYARTDFENKRKPKIVLNQRKTEAQVSAG